MAIQRFNVGTRVQLKVQRESGPAEYFSSLVGFVKNEYLLVKSPVLRKIPVTLHDGEAVQVRAFTGTTIYSCTATVEHSFGSPLHLMQLSYPKTIDSAALRSAMRVKVDLPAELAFTDEAGDARQAIGRLVNLSISGAAFEVEAPVHVGAEGTMTFTFQGEAAEHRVAARATVRSVHARAAERTEEPTRRVCGLQFHGIESSDRMAIRLLIYETVLSDRQNIV